MPQLMTLPAVFLVRPQTDRDISLIRVDGSYLLPAVAGQLLSQGLVGGVVVSAPESTPEYLKNVLRRWNLPIDLTGPDHPLKRLRHTMARWGWEKIVCLSAYSQFISAEALDFTRQAVASGKADFSFTADTITPKYLCALNSNAVEALCALTALPVPPNRFHYLASEKKNSLSIRRIERTETPTERFLWMLQFAGQRESIPIPVLSNFFAKTPPEKWFKAEQFRICLARILGAAKWPRLDRFFREHAGFSEHTLEFSTQFAWYHRWRSHIPQRGKRFLEIGFGRFPVTSSLLLDSFETGIALEPAGFDEAGVDTAYHLAALLRESFPLFRSGELHSHAEKPFHPGKRIRAESKRLQELRLPPESIDFCFSKTVFEHVLDVNSLSYELHRVLKPGGIMIHEIDFSDHRMPGTVHFDFLKYSKKEWRSGKNGTNLWRINDYVELLEKIGFRTEVLSREDTRLFPQEIHPEWREYREADLLCHTAVIKAIRA
jgi:SAM-dependent methyltransferase